MRRWLERSAAARCDRRVVEDGGAVHVEVHGVGVHRPVACGHDARDRSEARVARRPGVARGPAGRDRVPAPVPEDVVSTIGGSDPGPAGEKAGQIELAPVPPAHRHQPTDAGV